MSDLAEELRIIAKDARGMDKIDRDVLLKAADEIEAMPTPLSPLITRQAIIKSVLFGNFNSVPMMPKDLK